MRSKPTARLCLTLLVLVSATLALPAVALSPRALDRIPLHVLSTAAVERARAALPARPPGPAPERMALSLPLALGLDEGSWSAEDGHAVWRARLYSSGATALIPHFDRLQLPDGAELRVSTPDGSVVQGPYTQADVNVHGGLWAAMVPGEEAVIELRMASAAQDGAELHLAHLAHGLLPVTRDGIVGKAGSCHIDAVCPQGDGWRDQIRASVRLTIPTGLNNGTVYLCSGQLMNNTSQDDIPYVLTAHHCGITALNASDVTVYFNYRNSVCGGTPDATLQQNLSGAIWRFADVTADHELIELTRPVPAQYNVHLSGFDANPNALPQSGITLHYPSGDAQRISVYDTAARKQTITLSSGIDGDVRINTFEVRWSQGVTEPGSSGGALWNENRRLVGVLSGGSSSCDAPNDPDYFGRFHLAWDAGLRLFLDPETSGRRSFCGTDPGTDCDPDATSGGGSSTSGGTSTGGSSGSGSGTSTGSSGGGGGGAFGAVWVLLLAALVRRRQMARGR